MIKLVAMDSSLEEESQGPRQIDLIHQISGQAMSFPTLINDICLAGMPLRLTFLQIMWAVLFLFLAGLRRVFVFKFLLEYSCFTVLC